MPSPLLERPKEGKTAGSTGHLERKMRLIRVSGTYGMQVMMVPISVNKLDGPLRIRIFGHHVASKYVTDQVDSV